MSKTFPKTFGSDFFGRVLSTGDRCRTCVPGDWVIGMVNPLREGSGSLYLIVDEQCCATVHEADILRAGLPAVGITVYRALSLHDRVILRHLAMGSGTEFRRNGTKKRTALILGANGGVGSLAVQLYSALGWEVTASCRPETWALLTELGAHRCVPKTPAALDGMYDLVLDTPGVLRHRLRKTLIRPGGTYIPVSVPNREIPRALLASIIHLPRYRTRLVLAVPTRKILAILADISDKKIVTGVVHRIYELDSASAAVAQAAVGGFSGKILIRFSHTIRTRDSQPYGST